MKGRLQIAGGIGLGVAIFEATKLTVGEADWLRVIFVPAFALLVFLPLPKRWFQWDKSSRD